MATQTRTLFSGDTLNVTYTYDDQSLLVQSMTLDCSAGTQVHITVTNDQGSVLDQTYAVAPGHVVYDLTPASVKMVHRTVKGQNLTVLPLTITISILGA